MKRLIAVVAATVAGVTGTAAVLLNKKKAYEEKSKNDSEMVNEYLKRIKLEYDSHTEKLAELSKMESTESVLYAELHVTLANGLASLYNFHKNAYSAMKHVKIGRAHV